jgi:hypothetical protein
MMKVNVNVRSKLLAAAHRVFIAHHPPFTLYFLLSFSISESQDTYSNTTKMATIHDKLAQAQFEEKLKATILCES